MSGSCPDILVCTEKVDKRKLKLICKKNYKICWQKRTYRSPKEWLEEEKSS